MQSNVVPFSLVNVTPIFGNYKTPEKKYRYGGKPIKYKISPWIFQNPHYDQSLTSVDCIPN